MSKQETPEAPEQSHRPGRVAPFWEANQPTVLIAAPDARDAADLLILCRHRGIRTQLELTGAAALIAYGRQRPDAVVLGEDVPVVSAETVSAAINADGDTPVLLVSDSLNRSDGHEDSRGEGIFGSYTGVFSSSVFAGLAARSGTPWPSNEELVFGSLVMRPSAFEVRDEGEVVPLTLREFELLRVLMLAQGQTVTVEQLKSDVWGAVDESVKTETVKVHIYRLRQKLTRRVRPTAVRGIGYVLKTRTPTVERTEPKHHCV